MNQRIPLVTPSTAGMGPERRDEYIARSREELVRLSGQGHHAVAWALEAIDALSGNLHRAHQTIERLATLIPPTPIPPNPLSVVNPVRPRRRSGF